MAASGPGQRVPRNRGGAAPVDLSGAPQVTESHAAPVTPPAPSPPAVAPPAVVAEPPPAVVLAEPFVPGQIEDPNSGGSRPVIRVVGSGKPRAQGRRPDDRIEMTLRRARERGGASARPAAAAFTNVAESGAKQEYERGVALLNARDYDRALEAFGTYLVKWPDNARAEGAMTGAASATSRRESPPKPRTSSRPRSCASLKDRRSPTGSCGSASARSGSGTRRGRRPTSRG